jgi:hypothetical protein
MEGGGYVEEIRSMQAKAKIVLLLPLLLAACTRTPEVAPSMFLMNFSGLSTVRNCRQDIQFGAVHGGNSRSDGGDPQRFCAEIALDPSQESTFIAALSRELNAQIGRYKLTVLKEQWMYPILKDESSDDGVWGITLTYSTQYGRGTVDSWLLREGVGRWNHKVLLWITE